MKWIKIAVPDDFDDKLSCLKIEYPTINQQYPEIPDWKTNQVEIFQPQYRNVLDKGYIGLVDFMGGDQTVVDSARMSYGKGTRRVQEDRNLIRYLVRNRHYTPIEMVEIMWHVKAPIFVFRQWHRHRTACLAGDVKLTFDLPGGVERKGNQAYNLTIKQIYDKWQPSVRNTRPERQTNAYFKQSRVKGMLLRSCDEDTLTPYHTQICDIWENGVKPIIRVEFENGKVLRATADHQCFTNMGWMRLQDALDNNASFASTGKEIGYVSFDPEFKQEEIENEHWKIVPINENYYISTLGRVRSYNSLKIKSPTMTPQGYRVVSLSKDGISRAYLVHRLVLGAFDVLFDDQETRHIDNNRANNALQNLTVGSTAENAADRMLTGNSQRLSIIFIKPVDYGPDGNEMTYDMAVAGPYHNFLAGGVFVHNSINEYSARYSILSDDAYMPAHEHMKPQSSTNKQGRDGTLSEDNSYACWLQVQHAYSEAVQAYRYLLGDTKTASTSLLRRRELTEEFAMGKIKHLQETDPDWAPDKVTDQMLDEKLKEIFSACGLTFTDEKFHGEGLSRELARIVMPLGSYSEMYWKSDLRNTFNFLGLRCDPHAQDEIRAYADAMLDMLEPLAPICVAAFIDYQLEGRSISRMELDLIRKLYRMMSPTDDSIIENTMREAGAGTREIREFIDMLKKEPQ